jgi:hypothetical protein
VFVKDLLSAHAGTQIIAKSAGVLSAAMIVPASGSWYMYLTDPPGGGFLFDDADRGRIKDLTVTGVKDTWFVIAARVDMGDGTQRYYCNFQSGDRPVTYSAGATAIDYGGSTGHGLLLMTAGLSNAPYYDVLTHAGSPWTTQTLRVRIGNLAGVVDAELNPSGYGLYADNVFLKGKLAWPEGEISTGGISITSSGSYMDSREYKFTDGANYFGRLVGRYWDTQQNVNLSVRPVAGRTSYLTLEADAPAGKEAAVSLFAGSVGYGTCSLTLSMLDVTRYARISGCGLRVEKGLWVGGVATEPDDNDLHIDGSINKSTALGCSARRSTTQLLPNNTVTVLTWDVEIHDTDGCFTPTSYRLYARHAGYYLAGGNWRSATAATCDHQVGVHIRLNSTRWLALVRKAIFSGKLPFSSCAAGFFWMDVNDYVEISAYQDSGSDYYIAAAAANYPCNNGGWLTRLA